VDLKLDRAYLYGDALFTTVRVHKGEPLLWPLHLKRLKWGCKRLSIPYPGDGAIERSAFSQLQREEAVLRIQISRGFGPRGYRPPRRPKPQITVLWTPFREPDVGGGVAVRWCRIRLAIQPALAGIKHCNRLEQILARNEWEGEEIFEGLMLDTEGYVVGGTMTNLFWLERGELWTPRIDRCGVDGVMRRFLMASGGVREGRLLPARLLQAEALFLTNAVLGVVPVRELRDRGGTVREWSTERVIPWRERWLELFA